MIINYLTQLLREYLSSVIPTLKKAAIVVARAAVMGAVVAGLTALANVAPTVAAEFNLDPASTGQIVAFVLLTRDALKVKGF